jgi:hypothetical protein
VKKFKLEIRLGNAAMMDLRDVRGAMLNVMGQMAQAYFRDDPAPQGIIMDKNGNTVGEWSVE